MTFSILKLEIRHSLDFVMMEASTALLLREACGPKTDAARCARSILRRTSADSAKDEVNLAIESRDFIAKVAML